MSITLSTTRDEEYTTPILKEGLMNTAIQYKPHRILILMIILMLVPVMAAVADPAGGPARRITGEKEGTSQVQLLTDTVTIAKKGLEKITTNYGDTYALSRATIILDLDGHQVSIRKMLVPCDAEISYVTDEGVRRARRIKITRISNNATWQWTSSIPE